MPKRSTTNLQPTIPYERALPAFQKQLVALEKLKGRQWQEAESEEDAWEHFTQSIIEGTFGNPSTNLSKFLAARWAGQHNVGGVPPYQLQINYDLRMTRYEPLLKSIIDELRLRLPEEPPQEREIQGVYSPGETWRLYRDLSQLIAKAATEVFFVDAYLDEEVFNLYVDKVPNGVPVRMLTKGLKQNVEAVAKKYAVSRPLTLRSHPSVHDRLVFIDGRGWSLGQSIKDAAKKQPTSILALNEPELSGLRGEQQKLWDSSQIVI